MKVREIGKETGKRVRFFHIRVRYFIVQQGEREVEVGKRHRCESLDQNIDDDIRIVQIRVELIPKGRVNKIQVR